MRRCYVGKKFEISVHIIGVEFHGRGVEVQMSLFLFTLKLRLRDFMVIGQDFDLEWIATFGVHGTWLAGLIEASLIM